MSFAEVIPLRAHAPEDDNSFILSLIPDGLPGYFQEIAINLYRNSDLSQHEIVLLLTPFLVSSGKLPGEVCKQRLQRLKRETIKVNNSRKWSRILVPARKSLIESKRFSGLSIPLVLSIGHLDKQKRQKLLVYFCLIVRTLKRT